MSARRPPEYLLAIDPGEHPGFALFGLGNLSFCAAENPPNSDATKAILAVLVIERPVIYPESPVPPDDVVALAITAGRLAERYCPRGVEPIWVPARTWKGQVPKSVTRRRVLARSTPDELAVIDAMLHATPKSRQADVFDAIGLGRWWLASEGYRLFAAA